MHCMQVLCCGRRGRGRGGEGRERGVAMVYSHTLEWVIYSYEFVRLGKRQLLASKLLVKKQ